MKEIVLRLLHRRRRQMMSPGDRIGLRDLLGIPLGGSPVENLALLHERVHRAHGLLDGRVDVWTMAEVEVQVFDLKPLERRVTGFDHVLVAETHLRGLVATPENLARDAEAVAGPAGLADHVTHDPFRLAVSVD